MGLHWYPASMKPNSCACNKWVYCSHLKEVEMITRFKLLGVLKTQSTNCSKHQRRHELTLLAKRSTLAMANTAGHKFYPGDDHQCRLPGT